MGEVYRARDSRLGRDVALKVLPEVFASDPDRVRRFEKEARAASALNHPNMVTVYEVGAADSLSYIAMELVEGKTLREALAARAVSAQEASRCRVPDRERARAGARGGHRSSGSETRERDGVRGRAGEDPRLRTRQAHALRGGRRLRKGDPDAGGVRRGDGRLHVAGAGAGPAPGLPLGPVLVRLDPLRDGVRASGLPGQEPPSRRWRRSSTRSPSRSRRPTRGSRPLCAGSWGGV